MTGHNTPRPIRPAANREDDEESRGNLVLEAIFALDRRLDTMEAKLELLDARWAELEARPK